MAENKASVSVAMAVYNGGQYLAEQLQSIVDQTYAPVEIVITDDASTDNSVGIIEEFQKKYPFIRLYKNTENKGVTGTFENSVRMCMGEFIALSDQDDIWNLHKIEFMMRETGKEDAYFCNSALVDQSGKPLNKNFSSVMRMQSYYSGAAFLTGVCVPGHDILMKRKFAESILPFPGNIMFDRWISFCAAGGQGLKYIDMPLVKYRQHDSNTFGVKKSKKKKSHSPSEKFNIKLSELKTMAQAPISDGTTKQIILEMITHFHKNISLKRSLFFFRNRREILSIKNKSEFGKYLYCLKMFFKPNY